MIINNDADCEYGQHKQCTRHAPTDPNFFVHNHHTPWTNGHGGSNSNGLPHTKKKLVLGLVLVKNKIVKKWTWTDISLFFIPLFKGPLKPRNKKTHIKICQYTSVKSAVDMH